MKKGNVSAQPMGQSLSANFGRVIERELQAYLVVFPELASYFLTPSDREIIFNSTKVKEYISELIKVRKAEIEKGIGLENGDLLTILLQDEVFKDEPQMIIDETLTFFIGGS